jgi:pseudouridine synthase
MKGKKVVLTGAAGVFGGWFAKAFAAEGATLCLTDRPGVSLDALIASLPGSGHFAHPADLADAASVAALGVAVEAKWGSADILVNNAGVYPRGLLLDIAVEEWDRILDLNLRAPFLVTREIARRMEVPSSGWTRIYRARLFGKINQAELDHLASGTTIAGVKYGPIVADIERSKGMYSWATVSLKEGKNREVKRVMESLGLRVARLIRTAYGPFQLGQLAEGQLEEIPARLWREKLGIGRKKRTDPDD